MKLSGPDKIIIEAYIIAAILNLINEKELWIGMMEIINVYLIAWNFFLIFPQYLTEIHIFIVFLVAKQTPLLNFSTLQVRFTNWKLYKYPAEYKNVIVP